MGGTQVFNGQDSVLWNNVRDAFAGELTAMYRTLRSGQYFNYAHVKRMFEDHQAVWPERLWNEDQYNKYLVPFLTAADDNLYMLQGDKGSQRDWWLYNAFKYRDSKYVTGDALSNSIYFRGYTDATHPISDANITLTPYSHIVAAISFASATSGDSYMPTRRMQRNESYTFMNPMSNMWDTEIYIRSADRLSDVGDLSAMNMGSANFSAANKLQRLILGSSASGYVNTHLESLTVGANELLTLLNVCNCTALATNVDLTGCASIETVLATGSAVTGVQLPVGGHLERLELPATVTNLTIRNQSNLTTFSMEGYEAIQTLRIENTPNIPIEDIVDDAADLYRVRLVGVEWTATSASALMGTIEKLDNCIGLDVNDGNLDRAVVVGRVNVQSITNEQLMLINDLFPQLVVVVNGVPNYIVRYVNYDNSLLYRYIAQPGSAAVNPVGTGAITAPTRPEDDGGTYAFSGWGALPTNIQNSVVIVAQYTGTYRVRYVNPDGTVLQQSLVATGGTVQYTGSTPTFASTAQYSYSFKSWTGADDSRNGQVYRVIGPMTITAAYTSTVRTYTVYWRNSDGTTLETDNNVPYGGSATYNGSAPVHPVDPEHFSFTGFSPNGQNITGTTYCVAQYDDLNPLLVKYLSGTLEEWVSHTATRVGQYAFYHHTGLKRVETSAATIGPYAFYNSGLKHVDLLAAGEITMGDAAFGACDSLQEMFVRSASVPVITQNSLPQTALAAGAAIIYVPDNLVTAYKVATNWSRYGDRIFPISEYPVSDLSTISDSWAAIIASTMDGTYGDKYHLGDIKAMRVGLHCKDCMLYIR